MQTHVTVQLAWSSLGCKQRYTLAWRMLCLAQGCSEHAADLNRDTLCCSGKDDTAAVTMLTHNLDPALEIWHALYWEYSRATGVAAQTLKRWK